VVEYLQGVPPRRFLLEGLTMVSGLIVWIVLGLIAGYFAGKSVNRRGQSRVLDLLLGTVGAVGCGWLLTASRGAGASPVHIWSLIIAVVGAVFLVVLNSLRHSVRHA
jgi:uncharacterized membrane protein YeaQ/YmgE (transglycosylase-associated protein family)